MTPSPVDVAIIGAGPAGVTLGNLLGARGLRTAIYERDADIFPLPRAIHFDGEVMRVFETLGLRAQVEAISRPGLKGMHFVNAAGETLMIRAGSSASGERGPQGCANNHYFHQPELEAVLRAGLQRFPSVSLHLRHEVSEVQPLPDGFGGGAELAVSNLACGITTRVRARFVVGCDGARSLVRRLLATPMTDLGLHQPWLVFDVLLREDVPGLPDHTVQHCDPARPMTYCNVNGRRRRWEIMLMPGDDPAEMVRPERIWALVARWVTPAQATIERAAIYTFHSLIAQQWRRGPLLLAGDAAHQTPPFLGQGMCAAIRDVANLAWKLAAVCRGRAEDALLDSYGAERGPHVHAFIELAVRLGAVIQTTDPEAARARDARLLAGSPEIFEFPAPGLGPGVWLGAAGPAGQVAPQPLLDDGRGLDAAIGDRWAVIATPALLDAVGESMRAWWQWHDVAVLPATDRAVASWLQQQGTQAVLLRPDRYVAGLAGDAETLAGLTRSLPWMKTPPDGAG
ncbi:MAG: bifunctional 3-(3-hydroxy-phenyl)propionate/3-hydroxycinnamic acid hydroxylase [Burkholderiaceae bacterium]|nr:bifunctional 3-(3-hydroxy-phenyl)propionate/3-hydroxycinnamic acid hydroxylase [Burkholderiaceae bacterium]